MAVPDYQSLMYPVLAELRDGRECPMRDVRSRVAATLNLTSADMAEMVPSGRQTLFANRANWAHVYLKQAGLLRTIRRGIYQITERGQQALRDSPGSINNTYLSQFPEFLEFLQRAFGSGSKNGEVRSPVTTSLAVEAEEKTPDEQVSEAGVPVQVFGGFIIGISTPIYNA